MRRLLDEPPGQGSDGAVRPGSPQQRYVVTFSGKRDYYQVPLALSECGALAALVTDFYCPDALAPVASRIPGGWAEKLAGRRVSGLRSGKVRTPHVLLAVRAAGRSRRGKHVSIFRDPLARRLGESAGQLARTSGAGTITYSYFWPAFLAGMGGAVTDAPQILFQVHPVPSQVRSVLKADRARSAGLVGPPREEELLTAEEVAAIEADLRKADAAIAASTFVAQGLQQIGFPADRIHVVPYGGDFGPRLAESPPPRASTVDSERRPLRLLWVAQLVYRKGYHHLFEALRGLPAGSVEVTMICRPLSDANVLRDVPPDVEVRAAVTETELADMYRSHDVFVMPSLVEGFGLVYLEAMGMGLPVIGTENTGLPDVIEDGREGLIVEAGNADALRQAIATLVNDRERVLSMGEQALLTSSGLTWEKFRDGIQDAVRRIEAHPGRREY